MEDLLALSNEITNCRDLLLESRDFFLERYRRAPNANSRCATETDCITCGGFNRD
jgi:hypothetical protein